mmetsp:Transcript_12423/g.35318  ORF Transcript_12423/g.35318 Transcript_12423/m.35318 type:complete len:223 (-) Transcript_12423:348-1016(-)
MGRAPSAAWCPARLCRILVMPPRAPSSDLLKSCWKFTPVQASPGSDMRATTLSMPRSASRSLSALVKRALQALERQYWSKALNAAALVPSRSYTFSFFAKCRAPLLWETMRAEELARRRSMSSVASKRCPVAFTCTIASWPSALTSRGSLFEPPRPALRHSRSRRPRLWRTAAAKALTDSKLPRSSFASGMTTLAPGTARRTAAMAPASSASKPARPGTMTS